MENSGNEIGKKEEGDFLDILLESDLYLDLPLRERQNLLKHLSECCHTLGFSLLPKYEK